MKPLRLSPAAVALLLLALISSGCEHKKPVLVMPQQPPPTATPQPTATPAPAEAQPSEQQQEPQPTATPAEQPKTGEKTADQSKTKHGRNAAAKKPAAPARGEKPGTEVARNNSGKKIIPAEPSPTPTPPGQIAPGPSPGEATRSQTSTDQLLQGAEANINGITRQLSKDEEAMRAQIREFIKQSRTATTENDLARAHTLAVKARLLSDELIKQR
jgi:pyruvate dehydrogenase E2 component (dihydrolipoamide acetyltransferase)